MNAGVDKETPAAGKAEMALERANIEEPWGVSANPENRHNRDCPP